MKTLFDPVQVGNLHLRNRIVMAPLTRNRAPGAIPTPLMAEYYAQRAAAGLIISEATAITHQGQGYADVPGLYGTEQLDAWKQVTQAVHAQGGRIYCQLWHVGRVSHVELQPEHQLPVAPSALVAKTKTYLIRDGVGAFVPTSEPRALDAEEVPGIVRDFRHAARNALLAGFDGVEVHGANGYLVDQFLKTGANQRRDDYGGYDQALAAQALAQGADLVAFGRPFIANPDLVQRLRSGAPWNAVEKATLYGGGAKGYTDYPELAN